MAPTSAGAHPGAVGVFVIAVGVPTPIEVLVPADYGKPIDGVTLTAAPGFRIDSGTPPNGWTLTQTAGTLTFAGGVIPANTPGLLFGVKGTATTRGQMLFPVTTHSPDGSVMHYTEGPGSKNAGVIVYAGVAPRLLPRGTFPWKTVAGGVIVGVGVAGTGVILWLRRLTTRQ